jgi:hypothetical protein
VACNTQASPSIVVGIIEKRFGRKITQADWHESRNLASDLGFNTSKAKADPIEASTVFLDFVHSLSSQAPSPAQEGAYKAACRKFIEGRPTEGTLAIMRLYKERGTEKTLSILRAERKSEKVAEDLYPEGMAGYAHKRKDYKAHLRMFFQAKRNKDGVYVWQINENVPPAEVIEHWEKGNLISPEEAQTASVLRSAQLNEALDQYRKAQRRLTPEEIEERRAGMRAAFGPGQEIVDIFTGEKFQT